MWESLVRQNGQTCLSGSGLTGCNQRLWPACRRRREWCLCSRCPCSARMCPRKRWMQIAVTTKDFLSANGNLACVGLEPKLSLEPCKQIRTACARVRKRWTCAVVHVSWPCGVAKSFGSICLHRKKQRAAENVFLARLQRFFTCPTTISRVRRSFRE